MDGTILLLNSSTYERQKIRHILDKIGLFNIVEVEEFNQFKLLQLTFKDLKLVILDLTFPTENNGFQVLAKIRSSENREVPVIVVSQQDKPELKSEALKYTVNDYIIRPYPVKRLESSIRSFISVEKKFYYNTDKISDINMTFDSYVEREIKYSKRTGTPLSMILLTTLQLNTVSAEDGHITDDYKASIFTIAAKKAKEALRATDTIVLNNDRDIIIVLPCTDETGAQLVCEKIKSLSEPEFAKMNLDRNEYIYPVYVTFPKDGDTFQAIMQMAFKKISDKEMLERIVSIPSDKRKYADKSYNRYRKWL